MTQPVRLKLRLMLSGFKNTVLTQRTHGFPHSPAPLAQTRCSLWYLWVFLIGFVLPGLLPFLVYFLRNLIERSPQGWLRTTGFCPLVLRPNAGPSLHR